MFDLLPSFHYPPSAVTPVERKRKLGGNSPDPTFAADMSSTSASTSVVEEESGGRSSRRTRKSVNYALPKLNTKMRKPDPVDLIPASATSATSRSATPTSTRFTASSGNLSDIRRLHEAQRAEGSTAGTDEDESKDIEERKKSGSSSSLSSSGSKDVRRRVWGSNSLLEDDNETQEELMDLIEHSREVTDQDFEPTTDEDVVGPSTSSRRRQASVDAEDVPLPSSDGSSSTGSSKGSNSSTARRPSLRRRSDTLPSRTLTPSKVANSAQEVPPQSPTKVKSSSTPSVLPSTARKESSSESARSTHSNSTRAPTPSSAPPAGSNRPAKERPQYSTSISDSGTLLPERPRTYSGKSAAKAGISGGASGVTSLGRSALAGSRERGSLHAALTDGLEGFFPPSSPAIKSSISEGSLSANGGKKELELLGVSLPYASLSTTTVGSLSSAGSSGRNSPALSVSSQGSTSSKSQPSTSSNRPRSNLAPAITLSRPSPAAHPRPASKPPSSSSSATSPSSNQEVSSPRLSSNKPPSVNRQRVQVVVRHTPSSGSIASVRSGSNSSSNSSTSTVTGKEKNHVKSPSSPSNHSLPSSSSTTSSTSSSNSGSKRPVNRRVSSSSS